MAVHKKLKKLKPKALARDSLLKPTVFVLIFAAMGGAYLLYRILANTTNFAINNQLNTSLLAVDDPTASGGKALLFKSAPTPPTPPPPPPTPPTPPPPTSGDPQIPAAPTCTKNVTPSNAQSTINGAQAGDTICLDSGTYSGLCIDGKRGTASARITVMGMPGRSPRITGSACSMYWIVGIRNSDYVTVRNLEIHSGTGGVAIHSSTQIDLIQNYIHTINQDSINVAKNRTGSGYDGNSRNSSFIRIMGNTIKGRTNNTLSSSKWNEGIYLGHSQATYNLSTTNAPNNILIYKNDISWVGSECIDAKAFFHTLQIIENSCHHAKPESGGAFTISQVNDGNLPNFPPPNINTIIRGNKIYEIRRNPSSNVGNASVQICDGDVTYENNVIWNSDAGFTTCGTPSTSYRTITMKNNTIWNAPTAANGLGWISNPGGAHTMLFVNAGGNKSNQNLTFMGASIISSCSVCVP